MYSMADVGQGMDMYGSISKELNFHSIHKHGKVFGDLFGAGDTCWLRPMPDQSPQRNSPGATHRRGWEHGLHVYIGALNSCPMHQQIPNRLHFRQTLLLEETTFFAQCVLAFTFLEGLVCSKLD